METCVLNQRVMEKGRGAGRAGRRASVVSDGEGVTPCVQHRGTGACRSETDDGEHSIRTAAFQRSEEHPQPKVWTRGAGGGWGPGQAT